MDVVILVVIICPMIKHFPEAFMSHYLISKGFGIRKIYIVLPFVASKYFVVEKVVIENSSSHFHFYSKCKTMSYFLNDISTKKHIFGNS